MLRQRIWKLQFVALLTLSSLVLWAGETMVTAAGVPSLKVTVRGITPGKAIPRDFAFCIPARTGHVALGPNKSPAIQWSKGPAGTASYAIVMFDPDVPSSGENVNKEGRVVPASLKRVSFYHWILVDIPADVTALATGADSDGVTPRGKAPGPARYGVRGVNDYTNWFAGDAQMAGDWSVSALERCDSPPLPLRGVRAERAAPWTLREVHRPRCVKGHAGPCGRQRRGGGRLRAQPHSREKDRGEVGNHPQLTWVRFVAHRKPLTHYHRRHHAS